jgi:hypothetical protein
MKYILWDKEANQQLMFMQQTARNRNGVFFLKRTAWFNLHWTTCADSLI